MPHYVIASLSDNVTDREVADVINVLMKAGVQIIYNLEGLNLDIVDVQNYLRLVDPTINPITKNED